MSERDDYWKKIGRTYRGRSGKDRVLLRIENDEVFYRRVNESGVFCRSCWITTWVGWCKELLPVEVPA